MSYDLVLSHSKYKSIKSITKLSLPFCSTHSILYLKTPFLDTNICLFLRKFMYKVRFKTFSYICTNFNYKHILSILVQITIVFLWILVKFVVNHIIYPFLYKQARFQMDFTIRMTRTILAIDVKAVVGRRRRWRYCPVATVWRHLRTVFVRHMNRRNVIIGKW